MTDKGIKYVYNSISLLDGLLIEYQRYLCSIYSSQYYIMNKIKQWNNNATLFPFIKRAYTIKYEYLFGFQNIENIKETNRFNYYFLKNISVYDKSIEKLLQILDITVPNDIGIDEKKQLIEKLSILILQN